MINIVVFITHVSLVSIANLVFARIGKEALVAYISLLFVTANIFVLKQIVLCNLYATSADAFIIGISFGLNILQEYYGRAYAQKTIFISFACSIFYTLSAYCILFYQPATSDFAHEHFVFLITQTWRIVGASLISYLITQTIDTYLYAYMKRKTDNTYFVARNYISICFSQAIDTVLFSFLGLYGIMTNLFHIMLVSYIIKLLALMGTTPFLLITKKVLRGPKSDVKKI